METMSKNAGTKVIFVDKSVDKSDGLRNSIIEAM